MSFWGKALGWAEIAGGAIAAIPTGGASLALIPAGINTIQKINASDKAASQQATAGAAAQKQLTPYTSNWANAADALGYLMGITPGLSTNRMAPGNGIAVPGGSAYLPGGVGSPGGNAAGVLLAAPDGTQKLVAASQVQHYLDKGATVIQDQTHSSTAPPGFARTGTPVGTAVARPSGSY